MRELRDFQPDVYVTAYERFSMIASHILGRPPVSMDNQNELLHIKAPQGADRFAFWLARLATWVCTYGARFYVVKSFTKPYQEDDRVRFVSPIIQREIRELRPITGPHVLVYLTKENPELITILKSMDGTFRVYCNNQVGEEGNLSYRAQGATFVRDLCECRAIIATTGFSLVADSIYLRKPYFGVPLRKQFEQTHNAHFLADSGLGEYSENPTREQIKTFFSRLQVYRRRLEDFDLDPAEQEETLMGLLKTLDRGGAD